MKAVLLFLALTSAGCAFSFGPRQPATCYIFPNGERRCFESEDARRDWMSRETIRQVRQHEADDARRKAELKEKIRLRAAAQQALDTANQTDLDDDQVFDMQVEMSAQARALAGDAGASP